jgi:hypothetical protein
MIVDCPIRFMPDRPPNAETVRLLEWFLAQPYVWRWEVLAIAEAGL